MTYPRKYASSDAPPAILSLVAHLVPRLLEGKQPALAALREQFKQAKITSIEATGLGFYVDFEVPADLPLTDPRNFTGGDAVINLEGAQAPAGCVLYVREGRLATLEGYTFDDAWPEDAKVLSVEDVHPVF